MNHASNEPDGAAQHWPTPPLTIPPSFYAGPTDPLVSPDYSGWWRRSVALIRQVWRPALAIQLPTLALILAVQIPTQISADRAAAEVEAELDTAADPFAGLGQLLDASGTLLGVSSLLGVVQAFAVLAIAQLVVFAATGQPVRAASALGVAARRFPAAFGWSVLGGLLTMAAALACLLPAFYVGAVLMVLPVVVLLERGRGIGRCFQIFHADFGASVSRIGTYAGLTAALFVVIFALDMTVTLSVGGTPTTASSTVTALLDSLVMLATGVLGTPLLVTAYADLRARREPFSTAYLAPAPVAQVG